MIDPVGLKAPSVGVAETPRITGAEVSSAGNLPSDFTQVLSNLMTDAVHSMKQGEAVSLAGMQGKASTQEVVSAVMDAQQTLKTAIAIRDKAVAAYLELSRMSI